MQVSTMACKQAICDALMESAAQDGRVTVLCSDSRGSGSMAPFAAAFPGQFVEVGIAEQNLVSIAAGMARCGKLPVAVSPAAFLACRSLEQIKVDVAYSQADVILLGISGGVSYGPLGMTHHSCNDIACLASIPGVRVYLPCDARQAAALMAHLFNHPHPAYVRVGRSAVPDVYGEEDTAFLPGRAVCLKSGDDVTLVACGEMVRHALDAADQLSAEGVGAEVLDMCCVKPLDGQAVLEAARRTGRIITVEEHVLIGGLGSMVSQLVAESNGAKIVCLGLPDEPVITGEAAEVLRHYGLNAEGIAAAAKRLVAHG